ncbi:hypothetical protein HPB50_007956 [Hyalomma asiaticum]|uniref:Uncharacterized protein n=1 Tax=Hyalomma asiaticum TaxID=266040 RepID=A0ACB7S5K5_HYAAI|nr:hypothetical protein HPB50_007956 [Hyalomma asiaticum]
MSFEDEDSLAAPCADRSTQPFATASAEKLVTLVSYFHSLSAPNLIAMNRKVADKTQDDNRDRCLLEGVECLQKFAPKSKDFHCSRMFDDVVSFFKSNNLMLTQADKDGGFAVLPKGTYNEKALAAVNKNFAPEEFPTIRQANESRHRQSARQLPTRTERGQRRNSPSTTPRDYAEAAGGAASGSDD